MLHFRSNQPPLQTATLFSVSRSKAKQKNMCVSDFMGLQNRVGWECFKLHKTRHWFTDSLLQELTI